MGEYGTKGLLETDPALAYTIIIGALALAVIAIIGIWKVFQKAGEPGWAAIVPIYNVIILVKVAKKPGWWAAVILLAGIIPFVGFIIAIIFQIMVGIAIAKNFSKSEGFGVGLGLLGFIFYPILGFSDAAYVDNAEFNKNDELLDS